MNTEIVNYTTATQIAAAYRQSLSDILGAKKKVEEASERLSSVIHAGIDSSVSVSGCSSDEGIEREMKRITWKSIVDKLGIMSVMSQKKREELHNVFHGKGNEVDDLPEIEEKTIVDVVMGMANSASSFLDDAIQEVYEFLKPGRWDKLKTNENNRWKLSKKVIVPFAVEKWD